MVDQLELPGRSLCLWLHSLIDSLYMCVWKVGMERSFASFAPALGIALDCPSLKPNASIIGFH